MMSNLVKGPTASCSSGFVVLGDTAVASWRARLPVSASTCCLKTAGSMRYLAVGYIKTRWRRLSKTLPLPGVWLSLISQSRTQRLWQTRSKGRPTSLGLATSCAYRLGATKPLQLRWMTTNND